MIILLASFGLGRLSSSGIPAQITTAHPGNLGFALILVSYSYTGWNGAAATVICLVGLGALLPFAFVYRLMKTRHV